jgi:hypothetical protein
MDEANSVRVPVTGDCGHQFEVAIAGKDLETLEFACPDCGVTDRFTPDQITGIMADYERAKRAAIQQLRGDVGDMLAKAVRGKKNISYRPKR